MDGRVIGVIGLGIMGGAIARNLAERGWRIVGFDIDAARMAATVSEGIEIAADVTEIATKAALIMTSLPSSTAAEAVAHQIAAAGVPGTVVAELSTLAIADKLRFRDILESAGQIVLDCPLSGTGAQAARRDLVVYASGDSDAIARCMSAFADFSKQAIDLGEYGNGSRMKFIANHLVAIHNVAAAEAMLLAECAGLDLGQVVEVIAPGAGGSRMFQMRAPMMAQRTYDPATMKMSTWAKDMAVISGFAHDVGCGTPLFDMTQRVYSRALATGLSDKDTAAVFEVLRAENSKEDR